MLSAIPLPALYLGLGGLIPFAAGTVGVYVLDPLGATYALQAQIYYAVTIVSFLGAVHWGIAMAASGDLDWSRGIWGVTPALLAWSATWTTAPYAILILITGLMGTFLYDMKAIDADQAPEWYRPLRKILTAGAVGCLGVTLIRVAGGF